MSTGGSGWEGEDLELSGDGLSPEFVTHPHCPQRTRHESEAGSVDRLWGPTAHAEVHLCLASSTLSPASCNTEVLSLKRDKLTPAAALCDSTLA